MFSKSDLEPGMVAVFGDGTWGIYTIIKGKGIFSINDGLIMEADDYNEDLSFNNCDGITEAFLEELSIDKIYKPSLRNALSTLILNSKDGIPCEDYGFENVYEAEIEEDHSLDNVKELLETIRDLNSEEWKYLDMNMDVLKIQKLSEQMQDFVNAMSDAVEVFDVTKDIKTGMKLVCRNGNRLHVEGVTYDGNDDYYILSMETKNELDKKMLYYYTKELKLFGDREDSRDIMQVKDSDGKILWESSEVEND